MTLFLPLHLKDGRKFQLFSTNFKCTDSILILGAKKSQKYSKEFKKFDFTKTLLFTKLGCICKFRIIFVPNLDQGDQPEAKGVCRSGKEEGKIAPPFLTVIAIKKQT